MKPEFETSIVCTVRNQSASELKIMLLSNILNSTTTIK